jgi:signal transduction histidine kinase
MESGARSKAVIDDDTALINLGARSEARAEIMYEEHVEQVHARADRLFTVLMAAQWVVAVLVAFFVSPSAWADKTQAAHSHVAVALVLGGLLSGPPIVLGLKRPGAPANRFVMAVAQMLWSALFIHLTAGRIATHLHVFGSLAFLAIYRDWRVLVPATIVVAADLVLRGVLWPESVYGVASPEWWRPLEHAAWVLFLDVALVIACINAMDDFRAISLRQAEVELLQQGDRRKTERLKKALKDLQASQEARARTEKLAAVGQLAASVGHELRNPLAAVRNAATYVSRRITDPRFSDKPASSDAKVLQFLDVMMRELDASAKIISDLLDFARERKPALSPCPLRPLVEEAFGVVPKSSVKLVNDVPADFPVPHIDKDQFRQVIVNLVQNAAEACADVPGAQVTVRADGGEDGDPWTLRVIDNGHGMPKDVLENIFQPLFTTKVKGTGLGLAIVHNVVTAHKGTIRAESEVGKGTKFSIVLWPAVPMLGGSSAVAE